MHPFVQQVIERSRRLTDGIDRVIEKFIDDQDGAIADLGRPVMNMFHKGPDHFLGAPDLVEVIVRLREKFP